MKRKEEPAPTFKYGMVIQRNSDRILGQNIPMFWGLGPERCVTFSLSVAAQQGDALGPGDELVLMHGGCERHVTVASVQPDGASRVRVAARPSQGRRFPNEPRP